MLQGRLRAAVGPPPLRLGSCDHSMHSVAPPSSQLRQGTAPPRLLGAAPACPSPGLCPCSPRPLPTDSELWEDVHDIMGAGHETTATTAAAALYCIAAHPEVEARVVRELQEQLGECALPAGRPTLSGGRNTLVLPGS